MFVDANQTLILSEATQQVENANAPAMGRPACAVVPQVMNTGRAALSLGCCGARAYLDTLTDGMAIFTIPGAKLEAYTQRIEELAKANAVLSKFHALRKRDITAGLTPTVSLWRPSKPVVQLNEPEGAVGMLIDGFDNVSTLRVAKVETDRTDPVKSII